MPDTTPLAPMTPHAAISTFNYLRAVQAYDIDTAREFAGAQPRMPELARRRAERIVVPVTALPGPKAGEPCEDTFDLEGVFVTSLRIWGAGRAGHGGVHPPRRHRLRVAVPHRGPRGRR